LSAFAPPILLRDARFLVIDKPAGLPVHAGRAGGPSIEDYFPGWRHGRAGPWLAQRLDQDTAGCLVVALRKSALLAMQALFTAGAVGKTYWAVVDGDPPVAGRICRPLIKRTKGRQWRMEVDEGGDEAVTDFQVRGRVAGGAWIEFSPRTGRTHQIRAHSASIGCPIRGDTVYGGGAGPLMLLARRIVIPLDPPLDATAPVPAHMRAALQMCGHAAV
jgi:tRNA pseudouridine32 synthase/23S rRNA pseudouridine746 synthase